MDNETDRSSGGMVLRVQRRLDPYQRIPNDVLRDKRISWDALGILCNLLSHDADRWIVRIQDLRRPFPGNGHAAVRRAMKELEQAGYLRRHVERRPNGQVRTVTTVYDEPQPVETKLKLVDESTAS